jgi:hypothetical protein
VLNIDLTTTGGVNALAIDPTSGPTVYVGTEGGGVFKTTNGGASWSAVSNGLTSTDVHSLVIDPSRSQTIYAGTWGGGVFKTTNGGASWSAANSGMTGTNVMCLAIDPTSSQIVYAGTLFGGVFKTTTGGASWGRINSGMNRSWLYSLAIDPNNSRTVYAGLHNSGVYLYVNGAVPTLTGLTISSGPASVNEGGSVTYGATVTWDDGSATAVTPTWSVIPAIYASIDSTTGVLTTMAVPADQTVTVTADFTAGNVTKTATKTVTITNLPNTILFGDVNYDKIVNVFDALLTLQYAVGLYHPTDDATFKTAADVAPLDSSGKPKGDGQVNVFDALAILRHAVGLDLW